MGLIHSPSIVSDGLVLALDAQNSRSYGGSGTTWTDIAYRGNNGTLTNGPTFEPGGPFAGSTGGSVYFDGTGDYLSVANSSSFAFGAGDFTVEFWLYANSSSTTHGLVASDQTGNYWASLIFSNLLYWQTANGSTNLFNTSYSNYYNQWTHVAFVRNSGIVRLYLNGVQITSASDGTSYTSTSGNIDIGRDQDNSASLNGYISNLRIVKGTALYTSNFTPPTKPLTPVSGTSLLTCQGGAIVDNSNNKFSITRNGNVRAIQSASITFDGTNDYATIPASSDFDISSGAYTVELYVNFIASPSVVILLGLAGSSTSGNAHLLYQGGVLYWQTRGTGTNQTTYSWSPSLSRWYHLAVSWNGSNSLKLFIDGVEVASNTVSPTINQNGVNIGGASDGYSINGNISNVRIYKGKGLTASEVQRNFNALRNRFGI